MTVDPALAPARVVALADADPLRVAERFRTLADEWLIWDPFVAGERRIDLHPLVLSPALHRAAVAAAEDTVRIVSAAAERAFDDGEESARYRVHPSIEALARASHSAGDDTAVVRVDLLLGKDGRFHACEVNADCPGGHNEALALPRLARAAGYSALAENPTDVVEALVDQLTTLAEGGDVGIVFATAYAEDLQVAALVARALRERGVTVHLAPPTAPRFDGERLRIWGHPVRVLYRYFPMEYMEGQKNLPEIEAAVASGAVRTVSSFAQLFAQSKLAFARAWELFRPHGSAVAETWTAGAIGPAALVAERASWVLKRAFGRVGDDVLVGALETDEDWRALVADVTRDEARGGSWVAQRFVEQKTVETPWGPRYVTLGAYVLDGVFRGYFARLTPESHAGHDALVLPVFVDEAPR